MIDLRRGRAVRGRSGERHRYVPVKSRLAGPRGGDLSDPRALLVAYRDVLGIGTVYVADLDRIEGRGENDALLFRLLETVPRIRLLWDGGLTGATSGIGLCRNGRIAPVIGTETLRSIESLRSVQRPATAPRPILSLDLHAGGVVSRSPLVAPLSEEEILRQARRRGVRTAILLLLDQVGSAAGLPRERLQRLRRAAPDLELLAGGGIASIDDLLFLRDASFQGALLATALHDGILSPDDLAREGLLS
ncbi:MAG: hypothetical protein AUI47_04930 [Acidobacteria bacterium 13_1_40CM_2_68_5]|nr:MAG: hypothetical protein AUI47_04930 [Acidobacteria bacterium 13_1_40CM_2_68_5]